MNRSMRVPCRLALASLLAVGIAAGCSAPRDPILVEEGMVSVENQTDQEWRNVKITVNDHYSGGVPALAPGGRMTAPLSQFQTGLGQKFDRGRQSVFKVEVSASEPDGKAVTLTWGAPKPK
jgi:hypothetical protein